jgi:hypothetical protein
LFQALACIRPEFWTNWPDPKWFPKTMISCICRLTLTQEVDHISVLVSPV